MQSKSCLTVSALAMSLWRRSSSASRSSWLLIGPGLLRTPAFASSLMLILRPFFCTLVPNLGLRAAASCCCWWWMLCWRKTPPPPPSSSSPRGLCIAIPAPVAGLSMIRIGLLDDVRPIPPPPPLMLLFVSLLLLLCSPRMAPTSAARANPGASRGFPPMPFRFRSPPPAAFSSAARPGNLASLDGLGVCSTGFTPPGMRVESL
mmetsp:Transcript_28288/g.68864  ORF Transcript_28288/g.68864 Transcript_28288/m.68864 type:complete len:204 (-) Transcript_28288:1865-2476(-)